jgi:hypothetical protein
MEATVTNLLKVYKNLSKVEKGTLRREYTKRVHKNDDTFKRRIDQGFFPFHEKEEMEKVLSEVFPSGLPDIKTA